LLELLDRHDPMRHTPGANSREKIAVVEQEASLKAKVLVRALCSQLHPSQHAPHVAFLTSEIIAIEYESDKKNTLLGQALGIEGHGVPPALQRCSTEALLGDCSRGRSRR